MKFISVMFLLSLLTLSCTKSDGGSSGESTEPTAVNVEDGTDPTIDPIPDAEPSPPAPEPVSTVPAAALSFKTNVSYLLGFDSSDEEKYNKAIALVKKVVATEAFRKEVLGHSYNGEKTFVQNNGLTNAQIYQSILDAAERLTPAKNNTLDVGVKLYYENSNVVGYTNTSISYINVNTKFFDTYAVNSVASNLFHEWLHKIGFGHDVSATSRRPYSVPYAVGTIIRNLGKNFL